jgi:hypothetical protein
MMKGTVLSSSLSGGFMRAVACPHCGGWSRVGDAALGGQVACPHCGVAFVAERNPQAKPEAPVATVYPRRHVPEHDEPPSTPVNPLLVGLSLLPFGIPLVWLLLPLLFGNVPIFSYAAPTAMAVGISGLALGICYAADWNFGTRFRAILMLVLIGYGSAAFLYFMKREWAEAVRKRIGPPQVDWRDFSPPDKAYSARMPGAPRSEATSPLTGWPLTVYRSAPPRPNDPLIVVYEVGHGIALPDRKTTDDDWFAAAQAALVEASGGTITREKPITQQSHPGREYTLSMPDGATKRIVRIIRVRDKVFYLGVQSVFLAEDSRDVQIFFDKFLIAPK